MCIHTCWDSGHKFGFLAPKDAEEQLSLPHNPAPRGAGRLPRPEAAFHEVLQPPSPCCPFSSLAVKDGMELSAEVKAMSRLSESFCSWGIASAKGSRGLKSFSAGLGGLRQRFAPLIKTSLSKPGVCRAGLLNPPPRGRARAKEEWILAKGTEERAGLCNRGLEGEGNRY